MTIGLKTWWCSLALLVLMPTFARADVLMEGSDPVDRGTGTVIGNEIHWRSCNGKSQTVARPPYSFYKREGDCKGLGPMDVSTPPPDVFGLTCKKSPFVLGADTCTVTGEGLAQHFFKNVHDGAHVMLEKNDAGKSYFNHDGEKVDIKPGKWRDIFDTPSSNR
jgi:hypothetical protein